ncbi:MAG TPA: endonuclease [Bacteroidales bacterium]
MKNSILLIITLFFTSLIGAQQTGYYNGTEGKDGEQLKAALNDIISGHTVYSYFTSKEIFKLSDADPDNPSNVICVYSGFSYPNNNYGTSGNTLNREHVWAKSHGNFADWNPMYSDVHNLKPEDASVNQSKSNKDYDNGGTQHPEATECYFTDSTWEARDAVKGDIARIIFYMSTRYEGENGEIDLEVVDHNNTYPNAQHGKLSTLLQWNLQDPPDEFERNRNNVIYSFQKNRNPFIDNPEFAQLIWGGGTANPVSIANIHLNPENAVAEEPIEISATISSNAGSITAANLLWGLSFETLDNQVAMTATGDVFSASIPGQAQGVTVYYQIEATDGTNDNHSVNYNFYVPKIFTGTLVSIYDIQGQQDVSPYKDQIVSTSGVVTANFGSSYFIQDGSGDWNGLFIYESGRNPSIGDSVIITGTIDEYYNKTELKNITDYYLISSNNPLPEAIRVNTGYIQEAQESVLVKVDNAECTDDDYTGSGKFFMWAVNDGTGDLKIHNTSIFEFVPTEGVSYDITGPLNYDFDEWKIELRFESDVQSGTDLNAPTVLTAEPVINTNIKIIFSEAVETETAQTAANYEITDGITVESAVQHPFNKAQVNLTVSPLAGNYELTISNIKDIAGNVMVPQTIPLSWVGIEDVFANGKVSVFPNPVKNQLMISFNSLVNSSVEISLADMTGKKLVVNELSANLGENSFSLDLSSVSNGLYILQVTANEQSVRYKIIKN